MIIVHYPIYVFLRISQRLFHHPRQGGPVAVISRVHSTYWGYNPCYPFIFGQLYRPKITPFITIVGAHLVAINMPNKHQVPGAFWNVAQPKAFTNDFPMNLKLWLPHFNDNNENNNKQNIKDINYLGCSYKTQTWNISPLFGRRHKKHHFSFINNVFPFREKGQLSQSVWNASPEPGHLDRAVTTHHAHRLFDARQMSKSNDVHTLVFLRDSGMSVWKFRDFRVDVGKSKKITSDTGVMKYDMTPPPNFLQNYHVFALFDPPKWVIQWFLWKLRSFVCFVVVIVQGQGVKNMGMSSKNNIIFMYRHISIES